jgi:hypothetical protein
METAMSNVETKINATQEQIEAAKSKRLDAFIREIAEAELKDELEGGDAEIKTEAELEALLARRFRNE